MGNIYSIIAPKLPVFWYMWYMLYWIFKICIIIIYTVQATAMWIDGFSADD